MIYNFPIAYNGEKPYIFISYAHKDSEIVLHIIKKLQDDGFRVWYDEGIAAGSNWDVYISEHLDKCSNFIGFLSKAYIKSQNCKDELALSRKKGKPMNLIYIDDAELTPGLRMRYGRIQALFYNATNDDFFKKLYQSENMLNADNRGEY